MTLPFLSLHGRLARLGVDAVLFNTSDAVPSKNVRYLSGFTGSDASVLITRTERHLFTDGRYMTQARAQAPAFRISIVRNKLDALARCLATSGVHRLGIEAPRISYEFTSQLVRRLPALKLVPFKRQFLDDLRIRKTPEEKAIIKRAAAIASEACKEVLDSGIISKSEAEVAADLESLFRRKGAEGTAFETIVASGERSALPHGTATSKKIELGDLVIVDFGCRYLGYCSDETVTCTAGKASAAQRKMHQAVYEAHMRALDAVKDGLSGRELDRVARLSLEKAGFGKYFMHGLGHGVGLDVHEPPHLSPRGRGSLSEGMVFTIEPGVYVEGVGGVRLESLVYLAAGGPEVLTEMPKDLIPVA